MSRRVQHGSADGRSELLPMSVTSHRVVARLPLDVCLVVSPLITQTFELGLNARLQHRAAAFASRAMRMPPLLERRVRAPVEAPPYGGAGVQLVRRSRRRGRRRKVLRGIGWCAPASRAAHAAAARTLGQRRSKRGRRERRGRG